ncbi:MAG: IclR family transcriptional regulator [Christensenellales bacterium]
MADSIQVLTRTLDIIECLSEQKSGYGVTELANTVDLHKSTTYRILAALQDRGYVHKDNVTGKYCLSTKIVSLASVFLDQIELRTEAYQYLKDLAIQSQQTVHLGILKGTNVMYLEKVLVYSNIRTYSQIGKCMPAYRTSMGKVLISALPPQKREELINKISFLPHLPNTITDVDVFKKNILNVKRNGFAIDNIENETDIRCVAGPVYDYTGKVIASISLSGTASEFEGDALQRKIDMLINTCKYVSDALGYSVPT